MKHETQIQCTPEKHGGAFTIFFCVRSWSVFNFRFATAYVDFLKVVIILLFATVTFGSAQVYRSRNVPLGQEVREKSWSLVMEISWPP